MKITILAVTKREKGVCIAGVDENLKWIRPTKERELILEDIHLEDGSYIYPSNLYDLTLDKNVINGYQTENYTIDKNKPIKHIKTLDNSEREKLFVQISENDIIKSNPLLDISKILKRGNRSLILLGPLNLEAIKIHSDGKFETHVNCQLNSIKIKGQNEVYDLPCTDLKMRAFAKKLLRDRQLKDLTLNEQEIKELLKIEKVFIAIGLTGKYHGDYWPMIIAIHTIPDYKQEIDYDAL